VFISLQVRGISFKAEFLGNRFRWKVWDLYRDTIISVQLMAF